jgi:alpha-1,3-glucosyltransferase
VFKWKTRFAAPTLARAAAALSLAACGPSVAHQIRRPSAAGLLYAMLNASLAAFLLGFQVHEKSILLPLLPAALLGLHEPRLLQLFGPLAAFSMFPLLRFERLGGAYAACMGVLCVLGLLRPAGARVEQQGWGLPHAAWLAWGALAAAGCAALHATYALPAPPALPHLHAAGVSAFSAAHFVAFALYANVRQWQLPTEAQALAPLRPQRPATRPRRTGCE